MITGRHRHRHEPGAVRERGGVHRGTCAAAAVVECVFDAAWHRAVQYPTLYATALELNW